MKRLTRRAFFVGIAVLGLTSTALADNDHDACTLGTLRGTYVFAATGHNIVAGVPQPKAIVEIIEFHGNGIISVPNGTRSINGVVTRLLVGSGGYAVGRLLCGHDHVRRSRPDVRSVLLAEGRQALDDPDHAKYGAPGDRHAADASPIERPDRH